MGQQVANLCQLLEGFSRVLNEKKNNIQELAGISGAEYINMYKLYRVTEWILPLIRIQV